MKKRIEIYKTFDVVVVPFPFVDSCAAKKRPALVISSYQTFGIEAGHSIMCMITSAMSEEWPLDTKIEDLKKTGLSKDSVIRMKLFTIDHRLIISKIGSLSKHDQCTFTQNMLVLLRDILLMD
jgi:mRNA interferase MazF